MKNIRKQNGITLIALVITIIVLLILAGVTISMLSGENGILIRAVEAKEKTEEAQKEEMTNLASMELDTYFITNNSKYKCAYGYITGIGVENNKVVDTVETLQDNLPEGYKIVGDGITNETKLKTGIEVQKDGKTVAYTVVFGDNLCRGEYADAVNVMVSYQIAWDTYKYKEYQKVASDIDGNGYVEAYEMLSASAGVYVNQDRYASKLKEVVRIPMENIIKGIENLDNYSINKMNDADRESYEIKLNKEYTYKDLKKRNIK